MRKNWDSYFLQIAYQVATRATCDRAHVGCVIVRDKSILSYGYNGSVHKSDHCCDTGCIIRDGHCVRTIHAEINAVIHAARHGIRIDDGSLAYITHSPCYQCFKVLVNSGIGEIYYGQEYRLDDLIFDEANHLEIKMVNMDECMTLS